MYWKVNELAEDLRKEGINFVLVVEEGDVIYSQSSTTKESKLNNIRKEAIGLSRVGRILLIPGQEEIGK